MNTLHTTRRKAIFGALGGALIGAFATTAQADATMLRYSTMEAPHGPMERCFADPLLEELVAESGGAIEIEKYQGGTAFAHPLRQFEQVARGVMDISKGVLSYNPGQFAMTEVATMPLLVEDPEIVVRAINKLAPEYLADEFQDIHLMAVLVTNPLIVNTRGEVTSLADLEGMRIRSTGKGANAFLEALGAIPVQMPAPAVYENVQTGVIDGALAEPVALRGFRIEEVAEHHLLINTTSALIFLGMNKQALESLPAEVQDIVKTNFSGPEIGARAAVCWKDLAGSITEELNAAGHTFTELSAEDQARAEAIAAEVTEAYIAELEAQGKPARAFYEALMAEIAAQTSN